MNQKWNFIDQHKKEDQDAQHDYKEQSQSVFEHTLFKYHEDEVVLESYLVYCIRCTETSPLVITNKIS